VVFRQFNDTGPPPRVVATDSMPSSNSKCVILVPAFGQPVPKCDAALRTLEQRGYPVRRVGGFSAVDQGRNQMASEAVHEGFAETMFIDTDIGFEADAVEQLRSHKLPIVAGLYPQPAARSLAGELLPETKTIVFGEDGGLIEIKYAAAGFLYVRREAYETIRDKLKLPLCNTRFGRGSWPFFQPYWVEAEGSGFGVQGSDGGQETGDRRQETGADIRHRYLTEDFAFCERARQAGLKIMADTSIRLWRVGTYGFGWEDAGRDPERFDTYHFHVE
jgi:hypothetical protein